MMKSSELIYLPSEVVLYDANLDPANVRNFVVTDKPTNVLLLEPGQEQHPSYYRVLYNGEKWLVRKTDAVRGG